MASCFSSQVAIRQLAFLVFDPAGDRVLISRKSDLPGPLLYPDRDASDLLHDLREDLSHIGIAPGSLRLIDRQTVSPWPGLVEAEITLLLVQGDFRDLSQASCADIGTSLCERGAFSDAIESSTQNAALHALLLMLDRWYGLVHEVNKYSVEEFRNVMTRADTT